MKTIPLSRGYVALVDDEDFERLSKYKWYVMSCRNVMYAQTHGPVVGGKPTTILMHRLVAMAQKGTDVDHKDQNGLNNQKDNLRVCSHSQNLQNMDKKIKSRSGFKGVAYDKSARQRPWVARIRSGGRRITLGRFESTIEAAMCYNAAASHYFGEYARLNQNI